MNMDKYYLSQGSHQTAQDGRCAMEWVSYLAGEPHSDQPVCVSPMLKTFCIRLNDRLGDDDRQKLRPYLARTIGTAGDGLDDERVQMCREWLIHTSLPVYLDRAGRDQAAAYLRGLPPTLTLEATLDALKFARSEAYEARRTAVDRLKERITAELRQRGLNADAAAAAAAAAAADAAAVAAAAAAADADAVAVAVAAAAADADAAAAADADAVAAAVAWRSAWNAVYSAVKPKMVERAREINAEMLPSAFDLLDRMLPGEVIQLPVVEEWREIVGVA